MAPTFPRRAALVASVASGVLAAAVAAVQLGSAASAAQPGAVAPAAVNLRLAPYVDMGAWPTPSLSAMSSASGVKGFTLGFVTSAGCKASWFNAYDPRSGWQRSEVNKLRAKGGDVKISFGGASGIELAQACGDVTSVVREYQAVVTAYKATYVDFDIEGAAVAEPASIQRRSQAIARLQSANPGLRVSLTLPVLPSGLTADGVNVVKKAKAAGVKLDKVNVMAMDYYQGGGDMGAKARKAADSTQAQLSSIYGGNRYGMLGVTPMLGQNDDGAKFYQADARSLVSYARQKGVGFLGFWEETRDRNACTGALYKCTNIPQSPYEFSKIFAGFQ
jgi:Glycosyl hydrolases family 18